MHPLDVILRLIQIHVEEDVPIMELVLCAIEQDIY